MMQLNYSQFQRETSSDDTSKNIIANLKDVMANDPSLKDLVASVTQNRCIHYVSRGDWSMHELLLLLLEKTGPCDVFISSYAMSERAVRVLCDLRTNGSIISLRAIVDNRIDTRSAGSLQLLKNFCDQYRLIQTHAKVTLLFNDKWQIAVVGSSNYTINKRCEAGFIACDESIATFHKIWITHELNKRDDN